LIIFQLWYLQLGDAFEIFRVYTPNDQPYTNSLILNNKVFVPVMNSSWDDEALDVYQSALPNYEILPFTGSWMSTDALHCRVKGIPDISLYQYSSGDVNTDNLVNVLDIVLAVNFVLGLDIPSSIQNSLADMNSDGVLNVLDVILIVNEVIGE
tara:strand:- start:107 stop:565 length:459 start_codon:yes stop_codon:yes gene_type:complete